MIIHPIRRDINGDYIPEAGVVVVPKDRFRLKRLPEWRLLLVIPYNPSFSSVSVR